MEPGLVVPFGRYVLQERLARGGMGEVFRAVAVGEHGFEKPVVIKRVLPTHTGRDDLAALFVAEAKLMTRLAHPNIVEVLDFGRGEHRDYYLVLELVEGTDLGRLLRAVTGRGERFPVPLALFVVAQVLRGLHHAHTRAASEGAVVVHRDVSPSNVLCSSEGEVKLADFGVALVTRVAEPRDGRRGVVGKPGYIAPEQFDGGDLDPRADLFSAGVVLHQLLAGELPFRGDDVVSQRAAARAGERRPLTEVRDDVPPTVEAIVARALQARREERWSDARSMAHAIEKLRDEGQPLATGDDLAEAVRRARLDLPAGGRPVIALSEGTAHADDEDDAPRELTRTGDGEGGLGAFTVRLPAREEGRVARESSKPKPVDAPLVPEPKTERISGPRPIATDPRDLAPLPEPPRSRAPTIPRPALGIVAACLLAVAVFGLTRGEGAPSPAASVGQAAHETAREVAAPPTHQPALAAAPVEVASASASALEAPEAPSVAPPATPRLMGARPSATISPGAPVATGSASAAPQAAPGCSGVVAFASDGSWSVSGGPTGVQTPAIVTWPCGTYTVTARSRFDPGLARTTTVTVGPLQRASVDLRR